jgi:capsular polysaccharide biosynthesis protein
MSTTLVASPEQQDSSAPTAVRGGFRAVGGLLWRRRWTVALVFVLVANAIAAGLVVADRQYTAPAEIAATPQEDLSSSAASYDDLLGTVADVAESRPVLEEVASRVSGRSADQLSDEVDAHVVSGTVIIEVAVTDTDPEKAAAIANTIVALLPEHDPSNGLFQYHVTEDAVVPEHASSPNIPVTLLAGLVLALLLAVAAAAVADRVFRTVTDPEEMGEVSDTAVLGVIPKPADPQGMPAIDFWAEEFQAIRALRIAIEFASAEDPTRLLVVTSASASDPWAGWTEVNLAAALAEAGHRVLVVNTNRDDGGVHPALEAPGEPGLYDVLSGETDLGDAVREGPTEGVDVLPLGDAHLAAPSLLEMRFRGLLDDTEDDYDVVIAHAAPVSTSEDARIMAIHGALLLTVPSGAVHPRFVRRAADHLRSIRLRILGSVFLGVRPSRRPRRARTA